MALALFVSLLLVLTSGIAYAADNIILRSSVEPAEAWVGQRTLLHIEVLGADGWAQIPKLPDPELPGAYVMHTESQGVRLSETINRTSYTGQRYQLSVYCQRPGRLEIPESPVTVSVKQWGYPPKEEIHDRQTPATVLVCKVPPGAEAIRGLISTNRLEADQQWSSRTDTVALGDAVTRTVSLSADDVSGMAFPPTQHPEIDGVGLYPGQPTVNDTGDRGSRRGERVESVTYVFEKPGDIVLPTIVLPWWDIDDRILRRVELPGFELEVVGEPAPADTDQELAADPIEDSAGGLRTALLVIPIVAFAVWLGGHLWRRSTEWRTARRESEPTYFKKAVSAIRHGDPGDATAAVMGWLDRLDLDIRPARLDLFLQDHGDEATRDAAVSLARCLASGERFGDRGKLAGGLKKTRRHFIRSKRHQQKAAGVLPELNRKRGSQ